MESLLFIIFVGVITVYMFKKMAPIKETADQIRASRSLKERDDIFLYQEHSFFTSSPISVTQLFSKMDKSKFEGLDIEPEFKDDGIYFKIGLKTGSVKYLSNHYVITYLYKDTENLKYVMVESEGLLLAYKFQCNYLLTIIEEAFKSLDPSVEVQRKVVEFSSK
ncbi:TPA: hypothetical protein ACGO3A_002183 [Streptococcus suis]